MKSASFSVMGASTWVTDNNKLAGRGRKYHAVLIDEAAFTKSWKCSIWPRFYARRLLITVAVRGYFPRNGIDEK
ncbi:hypothetical protein O5624_02360 [Escherichia coli]|nr:hypothetical protein [Escherichia coli]